MNNNKINPVIEWVRINDKECLYFKFRDILSLDQAMQAIIYWKKQHDLKKGTKATIIWDCAVMQNYETEARRVWRIAVLELSDYIDDIWVISDSVIVLAGAEIISFFTKFKINTVESKDELYKKLTA